MHVTDDMLREELDDGVCQWTPIKTDGPPLFQICGGHQFPGQKRVICPNCDRVVEVVK